MVRGQLVTSSDQNVVPATGNLYHIVGHEPVAPLHEV
jgi:hypothetical protein